jgi:AraC-like DNA-binding protein
MMEWSPNMSMFCLKVERSALVDFAGPLLGEVERLDFKREVDSPQVLESLLGCFRLAELAVSRIPPGQHLSAPLAARIRDQILLTLLVSQPNTGSAALGSHDSSHRRSAVRRAVEFIEARPAAVTPSEVAKALGVSLRALEQNFRDVLGTTPVGYILKCRLQRAHAELSAGDAGTAETVGAIARRWGFSNLGRFAEQYRRAYGVTPSETLRGVARPPVRL